MKQNETILHAMHERYATKAFDATRRVSDEDIQTILESARLSPSAFGLQPWKFFVVQSAEVLKQLGDSVPHNRQKFECASHVIIFTRLKAITKDYVYEYFDLVKKLRNQTENDVEQYRDLILGKVSSMDESELNDWTSRQVYIALGSAIMSAALLGVDTCPMEGVDPPAFDKILGFKGTDYTTTVALALGCRSPEDPFLKLAKVRFAPDRIIEMV